jgi:hypothetical protein
MPKSVADELVAKGDRQLAKERLGIPDKFWNEPLHRFDVPDPMSRNARLPTGKETGANEMFVPGGYTSGGSPEMVIDPVPFSEMSKTENVL